GLERFGSEYYFFTRHTIAAAVGLVLLLIVSRIRYQFWAKLSVPLFAAQILLVAMTLFSSIGHTAQGASRWIRTPLLSFQPSELAKISVTLYFATLLTRNQNLTWKQWLAQLAPLGVLLGLLLLQPDMGTTILLCAVVFGMLFIGGLRPVYLYTLFGATATALAVTLMQSEYRRRRVFAFLNPWDDSQGAGFQTIQSFVSFHWGKLFGVGLGNGNSKLFFLPEVHTDFIFALIGEELGFVGAFALLVLFASFGYLLFKGALNASDSLGRLMGFGIALALVLQIAVNLGGVTGLLPLKGLPLPFISWGRSALLVNLFAMGILLNIIRQSQAKPPATPA
ncbi:putative lipid II flippase FtsW, partial [bacterium]|nr:putative lipid II flippase FtsW [bacterium]